MAVYTIEEIKNILPHRYPFILIDRVDEIIPGPNKDTRVGRKAIARKNVTINEPYFNGHFPHRAVMPGVLQIEAMAQAGGMACYDDSYEGDFELFIAGVQKAKFRKPVVPGDTLIIEAEVIKDRKGRGSTSMVVISCKSRVDGAVVSEVELLAHIHLINEV